MIGFNGGLIGADRTTSLSAAVGVWTPSEQIKARRTNIWPVLATTDPYYSSVSLLLHGDGANNSTTFTDNSPSPKTIQQNFGNVISTVQSRFNGASIFCNNSYMEYAANTDFEIGGGDFTIECWYRGTSTIGSPAIVAKGLHENSAGAYALRFQGSDAVRFYIGFGSSDANIITGTTNVRTSGEWNHIAVSKDNGSTRLFINGTQEGSTYTTAYTLATGGKLHIGRFYYSVGDGTVNGYIDDLRITKGVGRYGANFTPPTLPFPDA
jgi:hypothetical protein